MFDDDDGRGYLVVANDEEQYSIWPHDVAVPAGWRSVGVRGDRAQCVEYIGSVWIDMRPRSLRRAMDATG